MRQSLYSLSVVAMAAALGACGKNETAVVAVPAASAPAATVVVAPPPPPAGDASVIKIGHVAPTSGGIAHLGKDNEMGDAAAGRGDVTDLDHRGIAGGRRRRRDDDRRGRCGGGGHTTTAVSFLPQAPSAAAMATTDSE